MPADLTVHSRVALDASTIRPCTVSVPRSSSSSASRSPSGRSVSPASPAVALSGTAGPVAVLARADVPGGVERQAAQRARRAPGRDQAERAVRERPGRARGDPHPEHAGAVDRDVVRQRLDRRLAVLLRLDDHSVAVAVPGQGDRADPEVLGQRQVERAVIAQQRRSALGNVLGRPGASQHLVEKLVEALRQQADLELLKGDAGHPPRRGGLQVERPVTRLPYRTGHEPVRRVIVKDRHESYPSALPALLPAPPPITASLLSLAAGRGSRSATPPPVSLSLSTKGRSGV